MPWRRLSWADWAPVLLLACMVVVVAAPRLPPGVCQGDAGELQLAASVLGVSHSPGYPAYINLAHLFTYFPGIDPAYLVSAGCMAVGVLVLVLCAMISIRLGTHPWVACAIAWLLTSHSRFWQNLITPEVYIFSIAFLTASVYALTHYACTGRKRSLYVAAFLYAVAMVNRPPVLLAAPFFVLGWWLSRRRWESGWRPALRAFVTLVAWATLPVIYSLGYLYVRDTPQTRYNYIEHHQRETPELPRSDAGPVAKLQRVVWMATAREFHYRAGNSWKQVRAKLTWLRYELAGYHRAAPLAAAMIIGIGTLLVFRRCAATAIALCGIAMQGTFFILAYKDYGQAADLLPLLIPLTIVAATSLGALVASRARSEQNGLAVGVIAIVLAYTLLEFPERRDYGEHIDATDYLRDADLATFPDSAVIFSHWTFAPPLLYEREFRAHRPDVDVVIAQPGNWLRMAQQFGERPIFLARMPGPGHGRQFTPFRNVWRLSPPTEPGVPKGVVE